MGDIYECQNKIWQPISRCVHTLTNPFILLCARSLWHPLALHVCDLPAVNLLFHAISSLPGIQVFWCANVCLRVSPNKQSCIYTNTRDIFVKVLILLPNSGSRRKKSSQARKNRFLQVHMLTHKCETAISKHIKTACKSKEIYTAQKTPLWKNTSDLNLTEKALQ